MLISIGDNCIDRYVSPVEVARVGGNALNVAANIAIRGEPAAYAGVVGTDADGDWILRVLRASGVDTDCVQRADGVSGVTEIAIDGGDYQILREDYGVSAEIVVTAALRDFVLNHATLIHMTVTGEAGRLIGELKTFGVPLSLDLGIIRDANALRNVSALLPTVTYVFFSAGSAISEEDVAALLDEAQLLGCRCVVATRGAKGCSALDRGRRVDVASVVTPGSIVDPLGAGDAFIAGFLYGMEFGCGLKERLQLGSAWAAEACLHVGAWKVPGEDDLATSGGG
jgi:fructoselysine 6-kinase